MYAFGCPLKFVVSGQRGSNVTYHFDFDEENSKGTTTSLPETTHIFQQSPVDQKTVKITVSNPTSTRTQLFPLKFLPRITGLKIGNNGPIKMGKEVSINVTVVQKGKQLHSLANDNNRNRKLSFCIQVKIQLQIHLFQW